jgi:hypothetical protein
MVATMYSPAMRFPCITSDAAVKAMNGRTEHLEWREKNTPPNH